MANVFQSIFLLLCGFLHCFAQTKRNGVNIAQKVHNMTHTLDRLLNNYNARLRPGHGGLPTVVEADFNIRSMGPISEVDMTYSFDAYFRQTWSDNRLKFSGPFEELPVHIKVLEKIWKPDTFFYNGRGSYVHTITSPNKLLRIRQNGTLLYSMRLTIKASCPMYLHYFPVDEQLCPLQFGSYAYEHNQVKYNWKYGASNSIKMAKDMRLSQFDLVGHSAQNLTVKERNGEYSALKVKFQLRRHTGYFVIQVYVPCTLLVVLSWVSFWINREATADRVGLGVTTVLTLTTLCMDTRTDLPKVPYSTALDWFVLLCYAYVIASLLEVAGVHYFTKTGYGEYGNLPEDNEETETPNSSNHLKSNVNFSSNTRNTMFENVKRANGITYFDSGQDFSSNNIKSSKCTGSLSNIYRKTDSFCLKFLNCLRSDSKYKEMMTKTAKTPGINSVSAIDKASRILFPFSFIAINIFYWIAYTQY